MDHQGELQSLKLRVRYCYRYNLLDASYPDFRLIAKEIEDLLSTAILT